jgi:REP element-mobilizing transposase RayT
LLIVKYRKGVLQYAPTQPQSPKLRSPSQNIGAIIRGFKSAVTKRTNEKHSTPGRQLWQRNYYEHVIRDAESLNRIREYILTNPQRWDLDRQNPFRRGTDDFYHWLDSFKHPPVKR